MDTVPSRPKGLTTTTSMGKRRCQQCRRTGDIVWFPTPNGKLVCADCAGLKDEERFIRVVPDDE